jgi:hypothetical protein
MGRYDLVAVKTGPDHGYLGTAGQRFWSGSATG